MPKHLEPDDRCAVERWQAYEHLVAAIHRALDSSAYDIEPNISVTDESGAPHQVDIVLRPKAPMSGPILVSCKAWKDKVGIGHVREWADIVQQSGAAAGMIVAESGFSDDAITAARSRTRRVSLWTPRRLSTSDFGPDEKSPAGYIAAAHMQGILREPRVVDGTFELRAARADGHIEGKQLSFSFSAGSRSAWYLRDEQDNITGNLWDIFVEQALSVTRSGPLDVSLPEQSYFVLAGIRFRCLGFRVEIEVREHHLNASVDLLRDAFCYENAVTGAVRIVPLPPHFLQFDNRK